MTTPEAKPPLFQRLLKRPLLLILVGSLALHLLGGLIFGSWKIFTILTADEAEIEVVPPPPEAIQPQEREYKMKTMRNQRSTAIATQVPIAVDQPSDLNLPNIDIPSPQKNNTAIKARGEVGKIGGGSGLGGGDGRSGFSTLFGNTSPLAGALEGTFIDFKQDRNREAAPDNGWMEAGKDFMRNYNLREFRKYFNAPQKLYATHFYIPLMGADRAPQAYGVEQLVQPSNWVAVYQGKFRSMTGGTFRFVGTADDLLIVGVDGRTALYAGFTESNPSKWKPDDDPRYSPPPVSPYIPKLTEGDWFKLSPGEAKDLSVVIGEIPGGEFACYLFIEQKGVNYEKAPDGRPILPIFKLKELSQSDRNTILSDGYPKRLDGESFGFF
ncbi:hypothetical protein [Cerasicoccus arenae]|uniref:PA14 domain-containing protein n=1 Tax=Cerasicoccus arenae TaxID=424488 RepID=A0A8J3DBP5_9BACT|nr:hypothetical protein [Cerasicoccus arenae]MBK1857197.1 hypothetical protein [Cerasicoccus arenae]GHB99932.1 hypothetical protein GCM10007047_15170 [Cerasicoccus arenae]